MTGCGRIGTLISYQLCSESLGSGWFQKACSPLPGILRLGSLLAEFKADSSQVLAILYFPGSHPLLWILRTAENLWPVCLLWPKGEFTGTGEPWPELFPLRASVQQEAPPLRQPWALPPW